MGKNKKIYQRTPMAGHRRCSQTMGGLKWKLIGKSTQKNLI